MLPAAVPRPRPRLLAALVLVALAAGLTACGNKEETVTEAKTEGIYLDVGKLVYQVQISRELNPAQPEDRTYLSGIPAAMQGLTPEQAYFAVFLRVWNEGDSSVKAASEFDIVDTLGKRYTPIPLTSTNPFAYRALTLKPDGEIPIVDSVAAQGAVQGSVLVFKVDIASYQNRPLKFHIKAPDGGPEGTVDLDV
jgi:hypothetical protein